MYWNRRFILPGTLISSSKIFNCSLFCFFVRWSGYTGKKRRVLTYTVKSGSGSSGQATWSLQIDFLSFTMQCIPVYPVKYFGPYRHRLNRISLYWFRVPGTSSDRPSPLTNLSKKKDWEMDAMFIDLRLISTYAINITYRKCSHV